VSAITATRRTVISPITVSLTRDSRP
jgi:hypothetical protein